MGLKDRAAKLKTDIPALYLSLRDSETPVPAKVLASLTVAYALSPIDLIPDAIPVLGYLDDVILLPVLVWLTIKLIPRPVMSRCREQSEGLWEDGKPKCWYYALPIVVLWVLVICLVLRAVAG